LTPCKWILRRDQEAEEPTARAGHKQIDQLIGTGEDIEGRCSAAHALSISPSMRDYLKRALVLTVALGPCLIVRPKNYTPEACGGVTR
jgi:hypothetical protein